MRELKITHLYPELLNLYGDKGNIAALKCRAEWRNISVSVTEVRPGEKIDFENTDILFLGGGSDKELKNVLFIATGALLSPTSTLQGESIPCIAHAVSLSAE